MNAALRFNDEMKLPLKIILLLLLLVAGLPAVSVRAASVVATNLANLRLLVEQSSRTNLNVVLDGVVCEVAPEKSLLVLQDASAVDLLEIKSLPTDLRVGQRIQLTAKDCDVIWQRTRLQLRGAVVDIRVLGEGSLPNPAQFYIGQVIGAHGPNQWITMEGQVRFIAGRRDGMDLELRSPGNSRLQVEVLAEMDLPETLLLNSRIRATGIGRSVFSAADQKIWGVLTVMDRRKIQIVEVAPELWSSYPLRTLAEVAAADAGEVLVHLSGKIFRSANDTNAAPVLNDGTGEIFLERTREVLALAGKDAEAIGVLRREGTNFFLHGSCVRARAGSVEPAVLPTLTTAEQVLRSRREEVARGYPVRLRGVVTSVVNCQNFVVQDSTHGIFVQTTNFTSADCPQPGEYWEISGVSGEGFFSPMVRGQKLRRLGAGRLPEPVRPAWDQLINGSLDNQFTEIEGIITEFKTNAFTLLTHWGKISVAIVDQKLERFAAHQNQLVRLRGCLKAMWDDSTHQLIIGVVRLDNATINADQSLPADPFSVPVKTVGELRRFDLSAGAFQRVHLVGQVVAQRGEEFFLMSGNAGLRFIATPPGGVSVGDLVEVSGYPELGGPSPVLRETLVKKSGRAALPTAKNLPPENLMAAENDSLRVQVEGVLVNVQSGREETVLEMRAGLRSFMARLKTAGAGAENYSVGSRLRLTGVYAGQSGGRAGDTVVDSFELLVNSPLDVAVLARPPWWTLKKLLLALGVLLGVLALAGIWILLLRRQVERRTAQLKRETRERERAERAQALDEERLRIARDLHDDLGSSLTEITMLGNMGLVGEAEGARSDYVSQIVKKARDSVNALDVIVWAVNPKENSLQSLADYLASFADEFLTAAGINCRLTLPVSFPAVTLDGRTRHDLFLATKEALNNAVRHAHATEVELSLALEERQLVIRVVDNGGGFDKSGKSFGHGLGNLHNRLEKLGGDCQVDSIPGGGTTVTLRLTVVHTPFAG